MKQLSLKHKIALVELVVLMILGCYFFLPKSFSQAMGKGFDPDQVTAVTVQLEGARGKRGEDHTFTLSPTDPIYTELIDRLESRKYLPLYLNTTGLHLQLLRRPGHGREGRQDPHGPAQELRSLPVFPAGPAAGTGLNGKV